MRPNLLSLQWELLQDFWSASSYKLKIKNKKPAIHNSSIVGNYQGTKCLQSIEGLLLVTLVPSFTKVSENSGGQRKKKQNKQKPPEFRTIHIFCGFEKHFILCVYFQTSYLQFQNNVVILCFKEVFDLD